MKSMWYVYILRCADSSLYTGSTNDLNARVKIHNEGKGAKYTRGRLPVKLLYAEKQLDRSSAMRREREIKKYPRREKIVLVYSSKKRQKIG